jgi:hypothetical protein
VLGVLLRATLTSSTSVSQSYIRANTARTNGSRTTLTFHLLLRALGAAARTVEVVTASAGGGESSVQTSSVLGHGGSDFALGGKYGSSVGNEDVRNFRFSAGQLEDLNRWMDVRGVRFYSKAWMSQGMTSSSS